MPYDEYKNKPLDTLFIYAIKHGERVPVADIQVKIKSITATNIKQKNNPSKEKMLYTSKTTEGTFGFTGHLIKIKNIQNTKEVFFKSREEK